MAFTISKYVQSHRYSPTWMSLYKNGARPVVQRWRSRLEMLKMQFYSSTFYLWPPKNVKCKRFIAGLYKNIRRTNNCLLSQDEGMSRHICPLTGDVCKSLSSKNTQVKNFNIHWPFSFLYVTRNMNKDTFQSLLP